MHRFPNKFSLSTKIFVASNVDLPKKTATSTKEGFSYSLKPIYFFSRAFGLLPFSVISNSKGEIQKAQVKVFDLVWFAISICVYLYCAQFYGSNLEIQDEQNDSYILDLGDSLILIIDLVAGAVTVALDMRNRSRFIDILKNLTSFDKKVLGNVTYCIVFFSYFNQHMKHK